MMCHNACAHTALGWMRAWIVERILRRHSHCWYAGVVCDGRGR